MGLLRARPTIHSHSRKKNEEAMRWDMDTKEVVIGVDASGTNIGIED